MPITSQEGSSDGGAKKTPVPSIPIQIQHYNFPLHFRKSFTGLSGHYSGYLCRNFKNNQLQIVIGMSKRSQTVSTALRAALAETAITLKREGRMTLPSPLELSLLLC
jgi:hypothetical protein